MTLFEFIVPVIAFAVAGVGIWFVSRDAHRLEKPKHPSPAE